MFRVGDHDEGNLRHQPDEREVLEGVVGQLLVERGGGGMPSGQHDQRVAVGCGLGDDTGRNSPARPGLGLDDHGLPEVRRQAVSHDPRRHVGVAAGTEAVQQRDRALGPGRCSAGRKGSG